MAVNFYDKMNETLVKGSANVSYTDNGAKVYRTSGHALLDLNFAVSSLRNAPEIEIDAKFAAACAEDMAAAIVWLFFARDCRQGMGERRLFRVCTRYLAREFPYALVRLLPLFAEYGRWDDLFSLLDTQLSSPVLDILANQMRQDTANMLQGKPISLLAKWLPSEKSRVRSQRLNAALLAVKFRVTPRNYRRAVAKMRRYLDVIELKMSAGEWDKINYNAVPSRANLIYRKAFLKHDEDRRQKYLEALKSGEEGAKINSSVLMPHEIVAEYKASGNRSADDALEALWQALPNTLPDGAETIVVADGSGSMEWGLSYDKGIQPLDIANGLAIYFAERLHGVYHNRYITFSSRPQLVDLSGASTLFSKLRIARLHNECSNTNIEAVFDLILDTAVQNKLKQEELPKNILIVSDMQFDAGCYPRFDRSLFDGVKEKYSSHGYSLPRLVFWNVCGRTDTIPVKENDFGVALVSGFSPNVAKMVMSGTLDPYQCLMEQLHSDRYQPVWEALK